MYCLHQWFNVLMTIVVLRKQRMGTYRMGTDVRILEETRYRQT